MILIVAQRMRAAYSIRPLVFGLSAVVLAMLGQRALRMDEFLDAVLLFGAASALFLGAFWAKEFGPELPFTLPRNTGRSLPRVAWVAGTLVVVALTLTVAALRLFDAQDPNATLAWRLHIASVATLLVAALWVDVVERRGADPGAGVAAAECASSDAQRSDPHAHLRMPTPLDTSAWTIAGALLAIVVLAAFFRLYRFDVLPFGVWYDEAEYGLQALRILENPQFRPVFEGAINGPAHYLYLVALSFHLFGVSIQAVRAVNVLFGLATVLASYLVGRELFGRASGLMLAFLLAVSSWDVTLSRFGMHSTNTTPLFTLLTVGFLLRGLRLGRLTDFAFAGLWLGLGLCFYTSFRLFVPVVGLFLLQSVVVQWIGARRLPSRRFWLGVGWMALVAALVVAPVVLYAYRHPDIFWARVQDTFVFSDKSAPQRWPVLFDSLGKHLLMFNWHGDANGRHNLPGNPMLDDLCAALFVLGVVYSLRRVADPRYALLLLWLGFGLLGGILSLGFEAPQSLRANASLAAAYALAVVPLAVLMRAWALSGGRYYPRWAVWPAAILLAVVGALNFRTYFVAQAEDFAVWNSFSTPETIAARLLRNVDDTTDAYVTSFFLGHPTLKFLAPDARPYQALDVTDQLPLAFAPGRSALLIMNEESRGLYDQARQLYPDASFEEVMPPVAGPPVLYTVQLSPADIAGVQGSTGRYFANATRQGEPAVVRRDMSFDFAWPQDAPLATLFSAEWSGVLRAHLYGRYDFLLRAPGPTELSIGGQEVMSGTGMLSGTLMLAQGNYDLRMTTLGAPGQFSLAWRPPDRDWEVIPPSALYVPPVTANGLLGRYFPNAEWTAPAAFSRIDPHLRLYFHITPLPRPYTVEWAGKIAIPQTGLYAFGLESIDASALWIDGEPVVATAASNQYAEGAVQLEAGLHDIRVRFADTTDHTHINVYWSPPGGNRQIIPPAVLFPPQSDYAHVTIPALSSLLMDAAPVQGPALPAADLPGRATIVASGLQQPRGIAMALDGRVYVAANGEEGIAVLSSTGEKLGHLPAGHDALVEPSDVAVHYGNVYVLDAGAGQVRTYPLGEDPAVEVSVDPSLIGRSRGLTIDAHGQLWIAVTTGGRVVAAAMNGRPAAANPIWLGEGAQPVDVAVGRDGRFFVADVGHNRLIRFGPDGQLERTWNLPAANSLDSPHLAVDDQGMLYMTEPESGRVLKLDPDGEVFGAWNLPVSLGRYVKPVGIAVGPDGRIWITDSEGGNVIVIDPSDEQE